MIKKQKQSILFFLFIILFLASLFVFAEQAYAGSRFSSKSNYGDFGYYNKINNGGNKTDVNLNIKDYFFSLSKKYGKLLALLIFSPLIILHLFCSISASYFYLDRKANKIMACIIWLTIPALIIIYKLSLGIIIILGEILFSIYYIYLIIQYGGFITFYEKQQLEFDNSYQFREENILEPFIQNNPSFSLDTFKKRIDKAFRTVQKSWMKQNLIDSEVFMADGIYEQFRIQINGIKEKNLVEVIENLEIMNISVIKVESSLYYDSIYIAIQAKVLNYFINRETKTPLNKEPNSEPTIFSEVWSLSRRKGAKDLDNKGLMEGYCPNCGARIEGSRLVTCQSCNAFLRSGEKDWVLTNICQMSKWRDSINQYIPCIDYLMIQDPGFNIANIEDKLSAMFWRLIEASRRKITTPILKISTEEFANNYSDNSIFEHPEFNNYDGAAIDSIEVLNFGKKGNKILLFAQIIWNGYLPNKPNTLRHKKSIFVLRREKNISTDIKKIFCSTHCPNCGAIDSYNGSNLCEYCNTAVNDDKVDWILMDIYNSQNSHSKNLYSSNITAFEMETLKNPPKPKKEEHLSSDKTASYKKESTSSNILKNIASKSGLFKKHKLFSKALNKVSNFSSSNNDIPKAKDGIDWLSLRQYSSNDLLRLSIAVMLADGITDSKEMEILRKICKHGFISEQELQKNIFEMQGKINPVDYALETTSIKLDKNLMLVLIEIAASDGNIADPELNLLHKIADKMQMPEKDFRDLVNSVYEKNWEK